jgi:hypothetical protein
MYSTNQSYSHRHVSRPGSREEQGAERRWGGSSAASSAATVAKTKGEIARVSSVLPIYYAMTIRTQHGHRSTQNDVVEEREDYVP